MPHAQKEEGLRALQALSARIASISSVDDAVAGLPSASAGEAGVGSDGGSYRSTRDEDDDDSWQQQPLGEQEAAEGTSERKAEEAVPPLTGPEMRALILAKYGKQYDCSFVRRDIPGKTFVCLNIMWQHLEQRSFRLTPEQYEEKTDSIAYMVNVLGQTQRVRTVLSAKARSEKGLPKRPVVGTAVSE
jgi:hypothetical protein